MGEPLSDEEANILRHQARERPFELAHGDSELIEAIEKHIEQHIGPVENVFHEILSDLVHVDVMQVAPSSERPFWTLVTCGMSQLDMNAPPELLEQGHDMRRAELMMCLPPDWRMDQESFKDEANYWPVRWLKILARLPHEYQTWLGWGHSVPNGDPAQPFADNTKLCGLMLASPATTPEEFTELAVGDRAIHFYSAIALHTDEMNYKLKHGTEKLIELLAPAGVSELLDVNRPSVIRQKRRWFFR
jgi:hypothetical protein